MQSHVEKQKKGITSICSVPWTLDRSKPQKDILESWFEKSWFQSVFQSKSVWKHLTVSQIYWCFEKHLISFLYFEQTLFTASRTRLRFWTLLFTAILSSDLLSLDKNISRSSARFTSPLLKTRLKLGVVGQTSRAWGNNWQQMLNSSIASLVSCSSLFASLVFSEFPSSQSR